MKNEQMAAEVVEMLRRDEARRKWEKAQGDPAPVGLHGEDMAAAILDRIRKDDRERALETLQLYVKAAYRDGLAVGFSGGYGAGKNASREDPTGKEPTEEEPTREGKPTKKEPTKEEPAKEKPTKKEPTKEEQLAEDWQLAKDQWAEVWRLAEKLKDEPSELDEEEGTPLYDAATIEDARETMAMANLEELYPDMDDDVAWLCFQADLEEKVHVHGKALEELAQKILEEL